MRINNTNTPNTPNFGFAKIHNDAMWEVLDRAQRSKIGELIAKHNKSNPNIKVEIGSVERMQREFYCDFYEPGNNTKKIGKSIYEFEQYNIFQRALHWLGFGPSPVRFVKNMLKKADELAIQLEKEKPQKAKYIKDTLSCK